MKKIHIIRHAKSSWKDASLADRDRPLNKRGIRTCAYMAQHLVRADCSFDHIFCSPAVRAQETIRRLGTHLPDFAVEWSTDQALYTFDSDNLFAWLQACDDRIAAPTIIGHNPALTDLCNDLSDSDIDNIPTCGYVQLTLPSDMRWRNLSAGAAALSVFLQPKLLH